MKATDEKVVVVDSYDQSLGYIEKLQAHKLGFLHRAFSVFILDSKGRLLLQKRAESKYHSGGLWTNSCCSHPLPGESILQAANRRLTQELGISADLFSLFSFEYKTKFKNGLIENELDHVLYGVTDDLPILNPEEASDYKYVDLDFILQDIETNPDSYTVWFKLCFEEFKNQVENITETKQNVA